MTRVQDSLRPVRHEQPFIGPLVAIIPAYNEERFIGSIVLGAQAHVDRVIVVDDGSLDRTSEIAHKAGAIVIQHETNRGKAEAVNTGFAYARTLHPGAAVMLDGDGQHSASDIPGLLAPVLADRADVVVGSRFMNVKSHIPRYRQVGQHGLTLITNMASGVYISDSQSGFRAFSMRALDHLSFGKRGFSVESEMQFLVQEHGLRIAEVPIQVTYAEKAKRNPVSHGLQVVHNVLLLVGQLRPLLFFGLTGLLILVSGILLGFHIIDIHNETGNVAIGYGLITVMLTVTGMLLFFAGVILHSIRGLLTEVQRSLVGRLAPDFAALRLRKVSLPEAQADPAAVPAQEAVDYAYEYGA